MKRNLNSLLYAATLLSVLVLPGCSKEKPQAPTPSQAPQAKTAGAPVLAVHKPISSASAAAPQLDFSRRNDPFKPFAPVIAPVPVPKGDQHSVHPAADQLPIQSFEVSKFKVAGIIAGLTANRALILDPNGKGYVVQEGMLIGSSNGRITRITSTSVEVAESFKDERGRLKKRTTVLLLAKKR
jgi:type IV pilus assembly protein PilP